MTSIADNIVAVRRRITDTAKRCGKSPDAITLVAVSKTVGVEAATEAMTAGVIDLGESRVQEARAKFAQIGEKARWHMIGPLQTNKARQCIGLFDLVHSCDRIELLRELDRRAVRSDTVVNVLVQINIAGESQKSGRPPEEVADLLKEASTLSGVRIKGLMTIPPYNPDPEAARPVYRELAKIRDELESIGIENVTLTELSAGMSGDFEVAIEEGATIIRVGTAIFGKRS